MRPLFTTFCAACAPFLAACSNSSNGDEAFTGYPAQTTDGGTAEEQLSTTGISGFQSRTDNGTISEVLVRLDDSAEDPFDHIYYVAVDGGEEVAYTVDGISGSVVSLVDAEGNYLNFVPASSGAYFSVSGGDEPRLNYVDAYIGLQPVDLPEEPATYEGGLSSYSSLVGDFLRLDAPITIGVDFGSGTVSGGGDGTVGFQPDGGSYSIVGAMEVDITGTMDGAVLSGAAIVTGDATADLEMAGAVYGADSGELYGVTAGSASYDGGDFNMGGYFFTSLVE